MISVRVLNHAQFTVPVAFVLDRREDGYFILDTNGIWRKIAESNTGAFTYPNDCILPINELLP